MSVLLMPGRPHPGQSVDVEARLEVKSETPTDGVSFNLLGMETIAVPQGNNRTVWKHAHLHLRADHPGAKLAPGPHTYRVQFDLPADLPPSYLGRYARIEYTLEVRVDIPWWPDRVGRYDIPVTPPAVHAREQPGVFVSEAGGARPGALYTEVSLASTCVEPGGDLSGFVAFTNVAQDRPRAVRVALLACERLFADRTFWEGGAIRQSREVLRFEMQLTDGPPEEGVEIPFRIRIPEEAVPSFTSAICALDWKLEIVAERLIGSTPLVHVPLTIVPAGSGAQGTAHAAPAVGRVRRVQSLRHVGERVGLVYDEDHDDLHGGAGSVAIRVGVETRPDGALATVAHLTWPSLGMDLQIRPGSWTDRLAPREIEVGHERFDQRFSVQSRVREQAKALLDLELCELLLQLSDVRADDEGAALAVDMALVDEEPLARFVDVAAAAARAFDAAFARVPLPPLLAEHALAWRAGAARLGGRFEAGRAAILDATFGLERVSIVTRWSEAGEIGGTDIEMLLGTRIDPEAVTPAARAQVDALRARSGGDVSIDEEAIRLSLSSALQDPLSIEPLLEDMTRLVQSVRGRGAASPFR